jgi:hypothetical protein
VSREQALALARLAVAQVNALERSQPRDSDHTDLAQSLAAIEQLLGARVPARVASAKRSLVTWYFRKAGIDGMTDPFFLEIIVNPDLLPFERPFTLAHEWAHLAGYADEAEASAIGWSACMLGDATLVHSAAMFLLTEAGGALPPPVWRAVLSETDDGVIDDLRALEERLRAIQPEVQSASFKVYDRYLKANSVPDGVMSYSRVLQLVRLPVFRDQLNGLRFDQTARRVGPDDRDRPR